MANSTTTEQRAAAVPRLPFATCLGWGVGTLAVAALFNAVNVLLLRYLVDFVGIGAALAGTLIGLSKLYDAIIDPVVGAVSDRTRSRWGRRRPYLLVGGALLAISGVLLFNVPGGLPGSVKVIYVLTALIAYATAYAVFTVPYMAMPAEMTTDYHERSHLISFRVYATAVASLIATFVGPVLIAQAGGGQAGYTALSLFLACVVLISAYLCFRLTQGAPFQESVTQIRMSFSRKIALILGNRPFMLLLGIKLLQLMALAVTQASTPFLFKRVLGLSDSMLGLYFLIFYASMMIAQRFWLRAGRHFGKRNAYIAVTALYALMYLSWYFVKPGEPLAILFARAILLGGTAGGVLLLGQSLLPDTMEWDYRRTGLRREGMLSALYTVIEKLAFALGAATTGIVLGYAGYVQGKGSLVIAQPSSAIAAIFMLSSIVPMCLLLSSCVLLKYYDLSENKLSTSGPPSQEHD